MLTYLGAVAAVRLSLLSPVLADNELSVMRSLKAAYPEWQPRGIVDVGANRGGWTTNAQELYPGVKTFMVEATPSHLGILDETKKKFENIVDFEIALLSESDGQQVDFFDLDNGFGGTGNSMFLENSHHYKGLKPNKRTTKKLDTLLKERNMDYVDYLKLDVQVKLEKSLIFNIVQIITHFFISLLTMLNNGWLLSSFFLIPTGNSRGLNLLCWQGQPRH